MKNLLILILLLIFQAAYAQQEYQDNIDNTQNGKTIQDFSWKDAAGTEHKFSDIQADIIIIDIWATWCGPCIEKAPYFDKLREEYGSDKVRFISVSLDNTIEVWQAYLNKNNLSKDHFWTGADYTHPIKGFCLELEEYDGMKAVSISVPQFIIIGKEGKIINRKAGSPVNGSLEARLKELMVEYDLLKAEPIKEKTMPEKIETTADGRWLQNFVLKDREGNEVDFESINADIIVLDIWATWCGPCKDQAPYFDALREKLESEQVKFFSVSIDNKIGPWQRYAKKKDLGEHHYWAGNDSFHPIEWLTYAFIEVDGKKMVAAGVPNFVIIGFDKEIYKRNAGFPKNGDLEKDVRALMELYYGE